MCRKATFFNRQNTLTGLWGAVAHRHNRLPPFLPLYFLVAFTCQGHPFPCCSHLIFSEMAKWDKGVSCSWYAKSLSGHIVSNGMSFSQYVALKNFSNSTLHLSSCPWNTFTTLACDCRPSCSGKIFHFLSLREMRENKWVELLWALPSVTMWPCISNSKYWVQNYNGKTAHMSLIIFRTSSAWIYLVP